MALVNSQLLRRALACVTISMTFIEIAQAAPIPKWNKEERRPQNNSYLIAKAWEAVENWVNELKKESLDSLKSKKFNPLKNSGVTFYK